MASKNNSDLGKVSKLVDEVNKLLNDYNFDRDLDNYILKSTFISKSKVNKLCQYRDTVYKTSIDKATMVFKSEEEFVENPNEKFHVVKCDNNEKIELFLLYSLFYLLDNIHDKQHTYYIGLDFEFNEKRIALCQMSFYPFRDDRMIFVVDPNLLTAKQTDLLIQRIFRSPVVRLIHGSDSLDTPYMFEELFQRNVFTITDYVKNVIDTRFICEYYKGSVGAEDNKCSIYDALRYFKVITEEKYNSLHKINEVMGPVHDVNWNIKSMSSYHLKYAAYDVLYLKKFYYNMLKMGKIVGEETHRELLVVPYITRLVFLEKYDVSTIIKTYKDIVNSANNYFIQKPGRNLTFVEILNTVMGNIKIPKMEYLIQNLNNVNYFRGVLKVLFKIIVYGVLFKRFRVYKSKKEQVTMKLSYSEINKTLRQYELSGFLTILDIVYTKVNDAIDSYISL